MAHLVMFDIDGTLVDSLGAESIYYPLACEQALGLAGVSASWETYQNPTDRGIVSELVERQFNRSASASDYACVEKCFLSLLREAYRTKSKLCNEVPGAIIAFQRVQRIPDTVVSLATAGWNSTAKLKLSTAGFKIDGISITSSNDAATKTDIMRIAFERAKSQINVSDISSVTYIGDSAGDRRAAFALGFDFIGIDTGGFVSDAETSFADFTDWDAFSKAIFHFRSKISKNNRM